MTSLKKQLQDDLKALEEYDKHCNIDSYTIIATSKDGKDFYQAFNYTSAPHGLLSRMHLFVFERLLQITLDQQDLENDMIDLYNNSKMTKQ